MRERRDKVWAMSRDEMEKMLSDFWLEEGVREKGKDELLSIDREALKSEQIPLVITTSEENVAPITTNGILPRLGAKPLAKTVLTPVAGAWRRLGPCG